MQLKNFDIEGFLRDYWQKKPLLIKNPWAAWENPLEPDELAGLACEEGIEARLITGGAGTWALEHGPFPEERFGQLGEKQWTLLVQAVDHYVPQVAALIEPFRFIPNWRIDDVMVSCAADEGGVGPHYDQYDVFLVQGLGKRRWQIGGLCDESSALLPHDDLRLLANFEVTQEWVLEPGDILYVPPGIAHNGMGVGDDCMTYSIGFRAPSRSELISNFCDDLLAQMDDDDRYADPNLRIQKNPGEISPDALAQMHAMVTEKMANGDSFARWFGEYSTARKYSDEEYEAEEPIESEELRSRLADGAPLLRNPASRFTFIQAGENSLLLFVDGECFECAGELAVFAQQLCAQNSLTIGAELIGSDAGMELIAKLFNQGSVGIDGDD